MKVKLITIGLILSLAAGLAAGGLGINISLPEQGGTFVDMIKEHHRWLYPNNWAPLDEAEYDELGWPTTDAILMMDLRPVAEWASEIDDPDDYRVDYSGVYHGVFKGQALVQSWGGGAVQNVQYHASNNQTTFELTVGEPGNAEYGFFVLAFVDTRRSPDVKLKSGITELKLMRPGYDPATDQIFLDDLIQALNQPKFAAIRFKDFTGTDSGDPDYPDVTEWIDRSLPEHASQKRIDAVWKLGGAAWEYVIALANETEIDPWINVPVSASDDYVIQLAALFKNHLNPDLNIYVESSNEVWNTAPAFQQSTYNKEQAQALGIGEHENHARRTVQIAELFEQVFGKGTLNNRIRVILCSHYPMLKWWVKPFLQYLDNTKGDPSRYIYALACQSYFGAGSDAGESVETILAQCRDNIDEMVNDPATGRKKWIETARQYGFTGGFCFYEGGPDHGGGSTVNIANRIDAERSQGMADLFKLNYRQGFFDLGGNIAIQFTLTSAYNRYGCWGLTDDIHDLDRNYKFQAARELIENPTSVNSAAAPRSFVLHPNYPNPFNPSTQIEFDLNRPGHVALTIYNVMGETVQELLNQHCQAGIHAVHFHAESLSNGVYVIELKHDMEIIRNKCLLMK